jgi:hypothetical protein
MFTLSFRWPDEKVDSVSHRAIALPMFRRVPRVCFDPVSTPFPFCDLRAFVETVIHVYKGYTLSYLNCEHGSLGRVQNCGLGAEKSKLAGLLGGSLACGPNRNILDVALLDRNENSK